MLNGLRKGWGRLKEVVSRFRTRRNFSELRDMAKRTREEESAALRERVREEMTVEDLMASTKDLETSCNDTKLLLQQKIKEGAPKAELLELEEHITNGLALLEIMNRDIMRAKEEKRDRVYGLKV